MVTYEKPGAQERMKEIQKKDSKNYKASFLGSYEFRMSEYCHSDLGKKWS